MELDILKTRDAIQEAARALETLQENLDWALSSLDSAYIALDRMREEIAAQGHPEAEEDPLCGICMNPKSAHKLDGGFVPLEEPKVFDTSADTRNSPPVEPDMGEWDEIYGILGFGEQNER